MDEVVTNEENKTIERTGQNIDISQLIYVIRGRQVMIDSDLAILYQVETKNINKAMKKYFPIFMIPTMILLIQQYH